MTPLNFLLANQSLSFQIGSPNKKARFKLSGDHSEQSKQFPKFFAHILSRRAEWRGRIEAIVEGFERREYIID
jgi:hypothetical protein